MKQYSTYKPSNVEWLGDVPSHWKVDKLKNYCDIFASNVDKKIEEGEIEVSLCNYVDVYKNEKIDRSIDFMIASATQAEIEKFTLQLNDIILTKDSETPDDIAVPAIVKEVFENFLCGYHLSIIRCQKKIEPDFLIWALRDLHIATQFHREAVGITRFGLASKHFKNGIFAIPSRAEQTAIAAYLDQATANIDKVIATKQKQLEKLEQYKQSKIHECVTKGLNPDVTLKPSGIDWIGETPSNWKVVRIKDVIETVLGGGTPSTTNPNFWEGDIPWVSPKDMKCELIDKTEDYITEAGLKASATNLIPINTILVVVRSGILKHTLPVAINTVSVSLNQDMKGLVVNTKMNFRFLFHTLNAFEKAILTQCTKQVATVDSIESKLLFGFKILLPSPKEQAEISNFIDELTFKINNEKSIIELQIEKLKEYRKCLIHECVTGKRKVINEYL